MNGTNTTITTNCDWCLREVPVQIIEDNLWRFWGLISNEFPTKASLKNICEKCKTRYKGFLTYIESCKSNESVVMKVLTSVQVKEEPSIDIEYHPVIKEEVLNEEVPSDTTSPGDEEKGQLVGQVGVQPVRTDSQDEANTSFVCSCRGDLESHSRVHIVQKPFKCLLCAKTFDMFKTLKRHLEVHKGKPIECPLCSKTFTQLRSLKNHLRTHTGDKPFKCSYCTKSFSVSSTLKRHLNVHTGKKP